MPGKPSLDEYLEHHTAALELPDETKFKLNQNLIERALRESPFLAGIKQALSDAAKNYNNNSDLLFPFRYESLDLLSKSHGSVLNKVYRINCLHNKRFPDAPDSGFVNGENIYTRIDDIHRTRLVTRYLDGPGYLCQRLHEYAEALGLKSIFGSRANDRGYYAWHFYVSIQAEVFLGKDVKEVEAILEIQITTQLAEVLTTLTHEIYENERIAPRAGRPDDSWKWDPSELKFKTAYMGHTLHMLEGSILTLKDEVLGSPDPKDKGTK